ncbi:hypothetical protein [Rhodohalobacter sp.]|uniref:hypothetical protein n=1 Tax=Rhodohalobacter sp. TaxID=1974210 RepID=UPI002ACECC31|nr:hypothetical protein [Rhodohalobacter sp.]MDZ7757458.1 hypothetical protein [Rhodohalobacter sp.]
MEKETSSNNSNRGFNFVVKWSVLFFVVLVIVGLIYRSLYPVKLNLNQDEYIKQVFTIQKSDVYDEPSDTTTVVGEFEPSEILFVIDEQGDQYLVRPLLTTYIDSVWINQNHVFDYSREHYRQWQYVQDSRRFDSED